MRSEALPLTVADLMRKQATVRPDAPALQDAHGVLSFAALDRWACRIAQALLASGVHAGERIAVLAENRREYIGLQLAAAKIGAIVACLNWRLSDAEAAYGLSLVSPRLVFVSRRHAEVLVRLGWSECPVIGLEADFDGFVAGSTETAPLLEVDAEQGLVILYTSGTTGLPKGAVISQRAMVARAMCFAAEYGITAEHAYVAWSPLFHMAATDFSLATLMIGGKVIVQDGLDVDRLCATIERETIGWLVAMPGMIDQLIEGLRRNRTRPRSVQLVGAMADLVPLQQIAELTGLLGAPYINSFGATETGLAPASGALLAPGVVPTSLSKRESGFCRVRLVDADDRDVPPGSPGEAAIRGPTLFSGYWNAPQVNEHEFRGGWFHMGDLFVRRADGSLDFVDRAKYLIKSGGENIYPAEVERALLSQPGVADAVVVRRRDERWGEVPVAFVALQPGVSPDPEALLRGCRERLAGYKVPKEIRFVELASFPRSSTGKIQRHEVERQWLTA
jgi:fatty-acyl-CoA synthase